MHRIDGPGNVNGTWVPEDVAIQRPPTEFTAGWLNAVQEELAAIPEAAGLMLSGAENSQVLKAIKRLFGGHLRTITAAGPTVLTVDDAGLVIVDASTNNVAITMPAVNAVANAPLQFEFVRVDTSINTATVSSAGGNTFKGGATSFTLPGCGDYRSVVGDAVDSWVTTSVSPIATTTDYKASVRFTTTGNIVLSGLGTQAGGDWGAAMTAGDRVLPQLQTNGADRTIWIAAVGAWTRATDADGVGELTPGAQVTVEEGTTLADSTWELQTDGPITPGVTPLTWGRLGSTAKQLYGGSASVAANALTVSLDPCATDFRSTTLTSGAPVTVTSSAAISLTVPAGATLGTTASMQARLVVLEINNAGTKEVAIVNLAGGLNLDETGLISTTAISAASNSANVIYAQAARANVAYRVKMILDITEAAAGTWATAPTLVQSVGGQALAAMSSFGHGQTWQTMTGSRNLSTTYYNTTGKPIGLSVMANASGGSASMSMSVSGLTISSFSIAVGQSHTMNAIVPPGASYSVSVNTGTLGFWNELR